MINQTSGEHSGPCTSVLAIPPVGRERVPVRRYPPAPDRLNGPLKAVAVASIVSPAYAGAAGTTTLGGGPVDLWQVLSTSVRARLSDMNYGQQAMFACAVAERLLSRHERLPTEQRADFTVSLRPLLDAAWDIACGDQTRFTVVKQSLGEFYLSEFCHNDGQDGPDDAGEPAAAAVLYAAEFAMHGCLEFAISSGLCGEEAADNAGWDSEEPAEDADEDGLVYVELRRQLSDLDLIARHAEDLRYVRLGREIDTTSRLQRELKVQLAA
jgi:hypothetical protein